MRHTVSIYGIMLVMEISCIFLNMRAAIFANLVNVQSFSGVITRSMKQYQDLLSPEAYMSEQQYHLVKQVKLKHAENWIRQFRILFFLL